MKELFMIKHFAVILEVHLIIVLKERSRDGRAALSQGIHPFICESADNLKLYIRCERSRTMKLSSGGENKLQNFVNSKVEHFKTNKRNKKLTSRCTFKVTQP